MYSIIRLDEPWDSEYNQQFHDQVPSIFVCPTCESQNGKTSQTSYLRIVGSGTLTNGPDTISLDQVDNKESTILLVESTRPVCWMATEDFAMEDIEFRSYHVNEVNVAFCDCSALSVPDNIPPQFLAASARVHSKNKE